MTPATGGEPHSPDLFTLAEAPMKIRIRALESNAALQDAGDALPPRALQIAELVLSESIRLIRLGTTAELVEAADDLAQALIGPCLPRFEELQPDTYFILRAASIVLVAASAPSSSGGELGVLRSWAGKAIEVVAAVSHAPRQEMPRTALRRLLGDPEQSHLSHLLADLEAAGLILRSREGREVTVHLGPTGREDHVRDLLPPKAVSNFWVLGREEARVQPISTMVYSTISRSHRESRHFWMEPEPAAGELERWLAPEGAEPDSSSLEWRSRFHWNTPRNLLTFTMGDATREMQNVADPALGLPG